MDTISQTRLDEFAAAGRKASTLGLMRCSSGNLSWRIDDNRALLTASRSWMAELTADQVVVCRIADGTVLGDGTPSAESRFHLGLLRARPDVNVVLHFQSPCATVLGCTACEQVNFNVIPEVPYYIGPIAVVPYIAPGSDELAQAVVVAMAGHDMAILRNHGQVTVGQTLADAIQRAAFFELACEVIVRGGDAVERLSDESIVRLRVASGWI